MYCKCATKVWRENKVQTNSYEELITDTYPVIACRTKDSHFTMKVLI
jgi:hypothetical protein